MTDGAAQPDLSLDSPTISSASSSSSSPSGTQRPSAKRPYVESMDVDQDRTVQPGSPLEQSVHRTEDRQHKRARSSSSNPPSLLPRRDSDDGRSFVTAYESPTRASLPSTSTVPPPDDGSASASGSGMEVVDVDELEEEEEEDEDIVVVSPTQLEDEPTPVPMDLMRSPPRIESSPIAPPPRPPNPLPIPPRSFSYSPTRLFSPPPALSLTLPTPSSTSASTSTAETPNASSSLFPSQAQTRRFSEAIEPLRHSPPPIQSPPPSARLRGPPSTSRLRDVLIDARRNGLSRPNPHRLSSFSDIPEPSILAGPPSDLSSSDEEPMETGEWSRSLHRFRHAALDDSMFASQLMSRSPPRRSESAELRRVMREYERARSNLRRVLAEEPNARPRSVMETVGASDLWAEAESEGLRTARLHGTRWVDRPRPERDTNLRQPSVSSSTSSYQPEAVPWSNLRSSAFGPISRPPSISAPSTIRSSPAGWDSETPITVEDDSVPPPPRFANMLEIPSEEPGHTNLSTSNALPRPRQSAAISAAFRNRLSSILEDRARPAPSARRLNRPLSLVESHARLTDSPTSMFRQLDSQRQSASSGSGSAGSGTGMSTPSHRSSLILPPSWHAPSPQALQNPVWPPTPSGTMGWGISSGPLSGSSSSSFAIPPSPRTQDPLGLDAWGETDTWSPLTPSWPLPGAPRMMARNFSTTDLSQVRTGYTPQSSRSNSLVPGFQSPAPSLYAFMSPPGSTRGLLPVQGERPMGVERSPLRSELDLGWDVAGRRAWTEEMQSRSRPATLLNRSSSHPVPPTPAVDFMEDGDDPALADEIRRAQQAYARVRRRQSMLRGSQEFSATHTIAEEDGRPSDEERPEYPPDEPALAQRRRVGHTFDQHLSSPPSNLLFDTPEPETMVQRMNRMMAMRRESVQSRNASTPMTPGGAPSRTSRIPRAPLNVDGASASFARTTPAERDSSPSPTRLPRLAQARMSTGGRPPARMERERLREDRDREMLGLDISALQEHVREERLLRRRSSNFERSVYRPPSGFGFERDTIDIGFFESWGLAGTTPPMGGLPSSQIAQLPTGLYCECEEAKKEERCPICLEDYKEQDSVMGVTDCNHYFHKDCLSQWLQTKRSCPYCRQNINRGRRGRTGSGFPPVFGSGPGPGSASGSMFSL